MKRILPGAQRIRRILVMRWSALGDVAVASAALEDLHRAFPHARIHFNTMPPWEALFAGDPRLAGVISIPMRTRGNRLSGTRRWLSTIRRGGYDLVVDLQSNDRSRLLLSALQLSGAGIPWRLGMRPGWPYNLAPKGAPEKNAYLRQGAALGAAGIAARCLRPSLHVSGECRTRIEALQHRYGLEARRYGLLLPGSQAGGFLKRWGARNYIALAHAVIQKGWVDKLVLIGAGDELQACAEIERHCASWMVNLCGQTEVTQITALAEDARFAVANDTGPAHLAAAARRPLVLVCGPTDPERVQPGGPGISSLQAGIHCVSCYRKTCSHHACMTLVSPMEVMETLGALLG